MIKIFFLVASMLFFVGCTPSELKPEQSNKKTFQDEDSYILFGLRAEELHDYKTASDIFMTLYVKSNKKEYLYRSFENDLVAKKYAKVVERVDILEKDMPFDAFLTRFKVISLIELGELEQALALSLVLTQKTEKADDYLLTSEIYLKRQEYELALHYLEDAYKEKHNEKLVDKIALILYTNLGKKEEAITKLETHSRVLGCSELICARLAVFYANSSNLDALLATYLRLYELNKNPQIADKIVQIYQYKKEYILLVSFLEKSGVNNHLLLQLYSGAKNYKKAAVLAQKLYNESGEIDYLGESAIYEYEGAEGIKDKKLLNSVVSKLEKVVLSGDKPLYLNYLGYLLIDHEIDVDQGVKYIQEVLKIKPDSAYYLDSLAWGYYKQGKCKAAQKIMNRVMKLDGAEEAEVQSHIKVIDQCIKNKKRGKK